MKTLQTIVMALALTTLFACSCSRSTAPEQEKAITKTKVDNSVLTSIRLGDGVPLDIHLSVRWKIENVKSFKKQFNTTGAYHKQILVPRERELIGNIANAYGSVDSVFTSHREKFINEIKNILISSLGEENIGISEVIVSDIVFPKSFTAAMERVGLNERELELIRQENLLALEKAKADEEKARAEGRVTVTKAEIEGRVQEINAQTEEQRRKMALALAETESQVGVMQAESEAKRLKKLAEAEADKKRLLAQVDVDKQKQLENLEVDKHRQLENLEMEKQRKIDMMNFEREKELAELCTNNPTYASFLVNKEIASKVQIAVLPSGTDGGMIRNLLNGTLTSK